MNIIFPVILAWTIAFFLVAIAIKIIDVVSEEEEIK